MKKIRLCDADVELFDLELCPSEFRFFQKHRDVFRCMWREQDKPFWKRFIISFRSFTVKHGIIKQFSCDTPKFQNILDEAFIFIHEQFVDGKETTAKNFIEDTARLAQNQDKLQYLDSKSFAKDPFYVTETREVFRSFFGPPNQKTSLLKVYILSPVYLRFGGSVCRCLYRWMSAIPQDPSDDTYWVPPTEKQCSSSINLENPDICTDCKEEYSEKYFKEKISGNPDTPKFVDYWTGGDPRFNDPKNPLFCPNSPHGSDWRLELNVPEFVKFCHYTKLTYAPEYEQCKHCHILSKETGGLPKKKKKKNKKKKNKAIDENVINESSEVRNVTEKVDAASQTPNVGTCEHSKATETDMSDLKKVEKRRRIFGARAKITDEIKYGIAAGTNPGLAQNMRGSFRVLKIEEGDRMEMVVSVASLKNGEKTKGAIDNEPVPESALSGPFLRSKIEGLPEMFEWFENKKCCVAVFNYEMEERHLCSKPTNFSLKISGPNEDSVKKNMLKFLYYVAQRKKRPCPGWIIEEDDIVACIFPSEFSDIREISFCVQKGFRFEERLTDGERKLMEEAIDPYLPKKKKVLMTLDTVEAQDLMSLPDGRQQVKDLVTIINNGRVENEDYKLHTVDGISANVDMRDLVDKHIGTVSQEGRDDYLWEQMEQNPETFALFVLVDREKEPHLSSFGLKPLSLDEIRKNRSASRCKLCQLPKSSCKCRLEFVDHLVKTALATKVDSPDSDNTEAMVRVGLLNRLRHDNPEWFQDIKLNDPLPPLCDSNKQSDFTRALEKLSIQSMESTKVMNDLPPLVENKPVGKASVFTSSMPSCQSKQVVSPPNNGAVSPSNPPGFSIKIGNDPTGGNNGKGSGLQIGINMGPNPQVPDSPSVSVIPTNVTSTSHITTTSQAGSTIHTLPPDGAIKPGQISVKVERRSATGGPPKIDLIREQIHSAKEASENKPRTEVEANTTNSEANTNNSQSRGSKRGTMSINIRTFQHGTASSVPDKPIPHVHHQLKIVHKHQHSSGTSGPCSEPSADSQRGCHMTPLNKLESPVNQSLKSNLSAPVNSGNQRFCPLHNPVCQHHHGNRALNIKISTGQPITVTGQSSVTAGQPSTTPTQTASTTGQPSAVAGQLVTEKNDLAKSKNIAKVKPMVEFRHVTNKVDNGGEGCSGINVDNIQSTSVLSQDCTASTHSDTLKVESRTLVNASGDCHPETATDVCNSSNRDWTAIQNGLDSDITGSLLEANDSALFKKVAPRAEDNGQSNEDSVSGQVGVEKRIPGLRRCAKCGQEEPAPKKFKKCQKCKMESVANARYYCGRECQVADWAERHKREHKENLLN